MKKTIEKVSLMSIFQNGDADIYFLKLKSLAFPNNWMINEAGDRLVSTVNDNKEILISDICKHKVGDALVPQKKIISDIKLIRFGDITEELAARTGIEKVSSNSWKHYAPELFFPKKVLLNEKPGYPRYNSALGSYGSLFCKEYGFMDLYSNPWIWQFTCIAII